MIFAIFNSVFIPLTLSFDEIDDTLRNTISYVIIDQTANVFFVIDIIFGFNTSYYDKEGDEITEKKQIVRNYFFGRFLVDFLSSLPID